MTTSAYTPDTYNGDGILDTHAITFGFLSVSTNVKVSIKVDSTGVISVKTATTHYNITGSNVVFTAGNIPASGETIILELNPDFLQDSVYTENNSLPAVTLETDLDERNLESQINKDLISRGFRVDSAEDISSATLAVELPSSGTEVLTVDSTGLASSTAADLGVVTLPISVANGGTGASTLTDGGVLLGSGTGAVTAMGALADGEMIVGDGTTDPVAESGATLRTSIGVGTTDSPAFADVTLTGDLNMADTKGIRDGNDNEVVTFTETASAVNYLNVSNAASGGQPSITAAGDGSSISPLIAAKGVGAVIVQGIHLQLKYSTTTAGEFRIFEGSNNGGNSIGLTVDDALATSETLTLPVATDTLVGKATTDTLTNKTIDANGTGNSVTNIDVADLANGTDGELITWDAAGAPAAVAVGTSTHVLTSNGVGAAPTFQAAAGAGGDWVLIGTSTASSSSSVVFTTLSTTYRDFMITISGLTPATDTAQFLMRTSTDGGSSYDVGASDYAWVFGANRMATTPTQFEEGDDADTEIRVIPAAGSGANETANGAILLSNPQNTEYTGITTQFVTTAASGAKDILVGGGYRLSAADVDAIQFLYSGGNIATGQFTLYGLSAS